MYQSYVTGLGWVWTDADGTVLEVEETVEAVVAAQQELELMKPSDEGELPPGELDAW